MNKIKLILPHLLVIVGFAIISMVYFSAGKNKTLPQSDIQQWENAAEESLQWKKEHGEVPLWNSRMFGGMPNYQIAGRSVGLYASKIYQIILPSPQATVLFYLLTFGYIMFLCFQLNWKYALIGAIGLAFASYNFIIIEAGHNTKVQAIYNAPLVIGAMALLLRKKYWLGTGLLFLGMALLVSAAHYQITYYVFIIIGIWLVSEFIFILKERKSDVKHFFLVASIFVVGTLIGVSSFAVNFLLTQEYAKDTIRGKSELTIPVPGKEGEDATKNAEDGLDYEYAFGWSQGFRDVLTIIVPNAVGGGNSTGFAKSSEFVKEYRQQQPGFNVNQTKGLAYFGELPFTSGPVYFGAVLIFLFAFSMFVLKSRHRWWFLVVFGLGLIMSMGKHFPLINDLFYNYLPYYNKLRSPNMATTISQLIFIVPSLFGLVFILQNGKNKEGENSGKLDLFDSLSTDKIQKFLIYSLAITGGVSLLLLMMGGGEGIGDARTFGGATPESIIADRGTVVRNDVLRSLFFILATFGVLWFYLKEKIQANVVLVIIGLLVLVDLWSVDKRYLNNQSFESKSKYEATATEPSEVDKMILEDKTNFRVYDNGSGNAFNSARACRFHRAVGGYHAAKLRRIQDLAEFHLMRNNMKVLDMLNTKYFISNDSGKVGAQINPNALGNAWFVNNIKEVPNADAEIMELNTFDPANTAIVDVRYKDKISSFNSQDLDSNARIAITTFEPDKIIYDYNSATNQAVVFSEIYYNSGKGWQAYIDDKKVEHYRCNYVLRGMVLPAGKHKITFAFEPQTYFIAQKIQTSANIIAVVVFLLGMGMGIFQYVRKEEKA